MKKQTTKANTGAIPGAALDKATSDGQEFYLVERTQTIVHRYIVVGKNKTDAMNAWWQDEETERSETSASYYLGSQEISGGISIKEGPTSSENGGAK